MGNFWKAPDRRDKSLNILTGLVLIAVAVREELHLIARENWNGMMLNANVPLYLFAPFWAVVGVLFIFMRNLNALFLPLGIAVLSLIAHSLVITLAGNTTGLLYFAMAIVAVAAQGLRSHFRYRFT